MLYTTIHITHIGLNKYKIYNNKIWAFPANYLANTLSCLGCVCKTHKTPNIKVMVDSSVHAAFNV